MSEYTDPKGRTATPTPDAASVPVTLMNSFVVPEGRDEAFLMLWHETSKYFRAQPGFVSLRLHRAASEDAHYRFVNLARWASSADYLAAHQGDEFHRVVTQDGWHEFPSSPNLYEVVYAADAEPAPSVSVG